MAPAWLNKSATTPISGGIMAPPAIPMINNPEISLAFSGFLFKANEKIMENIFAMANPMMKTMSRILYSFDINSIMTVAGIAMSMLRVKNRLAEKRTKRIAPRKVPTVRATK